MIREGRYDGRYGRVAKAAECWRLRGAERVAHLCEFDRAL